MDQATTSRLQLVRTIRSSLVGPKLPLPEHLARWVPSRRAWHDERVCSRASPPAPAREGRQPRQNDRRLPAAPSEKVMMTTGESRREPRPHHLPFQGKPGPARLGQASRGTGPAIWDLHTYLLVAGRRLVGSMTCVRDSDQSLPACPCWCLCCWCCCWCCCCMVLVVLVLVLVLPPQLLQVHSLRYYAATDVRLARTSSRRVSTGPSQSEWSLPGGR